MSSPEFVGPNKADEPDEYSLYLGFMIPIGVILAICMLCLLLISWQLICPKCSKRYCPKCLLDSQRSAMRNSASRQTSVNRRRRRASLTLVRRYSDFPPTYETLSPEQSPPPYNSVVIIEEEAAPSNRNSRSSGIGIRTYVYDPARRISIEVHDEDTIRVVEEMLSRRRGSSQLSHNDPPGYNNVIHSPDIFPSTSGSAT